MTSWRFIMILEDDVMAVYETNAKVLKKKSSQVLEIDMNQFKSIWGLMLGILLLGVNWPGEAGLTPSVVHYI